MDKQLIIRSGILFIAEELKNHLKEMKRKQKRPYNKKRCWVRSWILRRKLFGVSDTLCKELEVEDVNTYRNMLRLDPDKFDELLRLVEPMIKKQDTHLREAIPAATRLQTTLRFLASGDSYKTLELMFRIPEPTLSRMIPEVLEAIVEVLQEYIKVPSTEEEWKKIQNDFFQLWNFPHAIGAIDGKHVNIKKPARSGSKFFNYKGTFSVVLFAFVDANYCFRYVDIGANGCASDASIFKNSKLNSALQSRTNFNIPEDAIILGDDAFPLRTDLMKPYAGKELDICQRVFNYRLSRARRIVENAFGILASRFRIFLSTIEVLPETTDSIIYACCALHNWLRLTSSKNYFPPGCVDIEDLSTNEVINGTWRNEIIPLQSVRRVGSNNYQKDAAAKRNELAEYFFNEGAVPWQMRAIGLE